MNARMNAHAAALLLLLLHLLQTHVVLVRAWDDTIPHKASWVSRTKHTPTIAHNRKHSHAPSRARQTKKTFARCATSRVLKPSQTFIA